MRIGKSALVTAGALLLAAGGAQAETGQTARASIGVRAVARTICKVQVEQAMAPSSNGVVDLGQMSELCNNLEGYRVVLTHAANLNGASAVVEGRSIPLDRSGRTVLVDANGPAARERALQVNLGDGAGRSVQLSLLAEPKGPVY